MVIAVVLVALLPMVVIAGGLTASIAYLTSTNSSSCTIGILVSNSTDVAYTVFDLDDEFPGEIWLCRDTDEAALLMGNTVGKIRLHGPLLIRNLPAITFRPGEKKFYVLALNDANVTYFGGRIDRKSAILGMLHSVDTRVHFNLLGEQRLPKEAHEVAEAGSKEKAKPPAPKPKKEAEESGQRVQTNIFDCESPTPKP